MTIESLYEGAALNDVERASLNILAEEIKKGKVILFLGASVHCQPPNTHEDLYKKHLRPPSVNQLSEFLSKVLPPEAKSKNLSWIAQYYESFLSRKQLIDQVSDILDNREPSPLLKALADMHFNFILTTNYDNLYEKALLAAGKSITNKGIYKPNKILLDRSGIRHIPEPTTNFPINAINAQNPFIYKIHGDILDVRDSDGRYDPNKDAIVITDEDYIHFILRMGEKDPISGNNFNPIPTSFTRALSDPDDVTVLFIGYSLLDYNLRLLFKSSMWKKDVQYQLRKWSVDIKPDKSIKDLYKGLYTITFIEKDAWIVIPYLYKQIFNRDLVI